MTTSSNGEHQPSPEQVHPFPLVGDVVSTDHFPSGVVLSSFYPDGISAAAINVLEDGSEQLGFPGTIAATEIHTIEGHWDVDRIVNAWAKTWETWGSEMPAEKKLEFRNDLLGKIALRNVQPPAN